MTSFAPAAALPRVVPLDPAKHVNYTPGMLLGVDDFQQEFAYHQGRLRWVVRDLVGSGTAWGLAVSFRESDDDVQVVVSPGVAVSPCGSMICVSPTQCASLDTWIAEHSADVKARAGAVPGPVRLYVVVCFRECLTDEIPIPGEPCRSTDELMAPSRVKDDFRLELRFDPPGQPDEDATIDLVTWLRRIPVVDGAGTALDEFTEVIREAIHGAVYRSPPASPPEGPPLLLGEPPAGVSIPAGAVTSYLRAALRVWVTEGVPLLRRCGAGCECGCAGGCGCADTAGTRDEECDDAVLLAALDLALELPPGGGIRLAPDGWALDESTRPFLLSTRTLQEAAAPAGQTTLAPAGEPVLAGGRVNADGTVAFSYGGLEVKKKGPDLFRLTGWEGADRSEQSIVTGAPIASTDIGYCFEVVAPSVAPDADVWVRVRWTDPTTAAGEPQTTAFDVHIVDLGETA